ncbi:probable LRR receptor-like protein kinase At1g51890 isoform X1 [Musa acuminata AAA Group]|uniref:probable LRR receptor-like protein kinase At1g51890 isoform X1 n=1 Tax=Musa acuminata AAA Group TaxID=214697 RepID=UPI0031D1DABE
MVFGFFLLLSVITAPAIAQPNTRGFISIDCGNSNSSYFDTVTQVPYVSDDRFIDVGSDFYIQSNYRNSSVPTLQLNLRSFPNGLRNCYTLKPVPQNSTYLVRATFMYGNYDGKNSQIQFDLHIGVDHWKTMTISDPSAIYTAEALSLATANSTSVCLVNTGDGTPFISSLELRPLRNGLYGEYVNASQSVVLVTRRNFGATKSLRFPDDPYDRVWNPYTDPSWLTLSTNSTVDNRDDLFEPPAAVMKTAVTPKRVRQLAFAWDSVSPDDELYAVLYFAELRNLTGKATRMFNVTRNGESRFSWYAPPYLSLGYIYSVVPFEGYYRYGYVLHATSNSTLPPIINAFEVYSLMQLTQAATDSRDVDAMAEIRLQYQLKRNWMGDPCAPKAYTWDGLNCSYGPDPPRIISINLTSAGLSGEISSSFAMLKAVKHLYLSHNNFNGTIPDSLGSLSSLRVLDLSCNNLTGNIPDSLGLLSSLQVLNLSGNNFNGSVPDTLLKKSATGLLTLRVDKEGCTKVPSSSTKHKTHVVVIISVVSGLLLLVVVLIVIVWSTRRLRGQDSNTFVQPQSEDHFLQRDHQVSFEGWQFTYAQLVNITNNFTRVIGKGGFGMIYHGCLETGKQVAIKMCFVSSPQGMKEFLAEAQNLTRIYHRNLVSLVGYCMDGNCPTLVYEYMKQGSLQEHLRGKAGHSRGLSWGQRLQIALNAAQGLEYLHRGCKPPIIHRDVKTSNILLNEELEARIADFGLSKSFQSDEQTHISTKSVVGTPGYIDPEYHQTYQLTEKSDVYSFGVVLLELITGRPPLVPGSENTHIVQWITPHLSMGSIDDIVDESLRGEYDPTCVWKILDLAIRCTANKGSQRPTMFEVVMQLRSCLELVIASDKCENENVYSGDFNVDQESASDIGTNMPGPTVPTR